VVWSYSKKRAATFDEVANSIFEEDKTEKMNKSDHHDTDNKQETNNNV
jgi:cbb3-type cytochrome oxidase subunit 3